MSYQPHLFSSGLSYVFRIKPMYAYNPINLFAIAVVAQLPSTHHCFVQSEEEDLVTVRSHRLRSSTELALLSRVPSPDTV